jgi:hypothetical protein
MEKETIKEEKMKMNINVKGILTSKIQKTYALELDMTKPNSWIDNKGQEYLNLFTGPPHDLSQSYKDMDKGVIEEMMYVWDFLFKYWCSGIKEQFDFLRKWIYWAVIGIKTEVAVICRGDEGLVSQ